MTAAVRRRRAVALVAALALIAVAAVLVARALGGGPPEDRLAALVPPSALVYAHASTDPDRAADARMLRTLERFPALRRLRDAAVRRVGGRSRGFSLQRDVRPWLGDEAAFALLPSPSGGEAADSLILAAVRDRDLARVFVQRSGARGVEVHRGVDVVRLGEVSAAVSRDVLLIGQPAGVRTAIDLQQGRGRGLAGEPGFARAAIEELDERVIEVYATAGGARGILAPRLRTLSGLLALPGAEAVRAAAAPDPTGVRVRSRVVRPRGAGRRPSFEPRLARAAPPGAAGVIALSSLDPVIRRLLAGDPQIRGAVRDVGVDLERDLQAPVRGREVALWLTPGDPVPGLALAAATREPQRAREALSSLQGPLSALLAPTGLGAGQVPLFEQRQVAGVTAFSLGLALGTQLTYAVFGSTVVLEAGTDAIERVRRGGRGLLAAAEAEKRIEIPANGVEAILFFEPGQLLALGDLLGVTAGSGLQAIREDVQGVRAVSAVAQREETDTTAELLFQIP